MVVHYSEGDRTTNEPFSTHSIFFLLALYAKETSFQIIQSIQLVTEINWLICLLAQLYQ